MAEIVTAPRTRPAPEAEVAADMARRALVVGPVLVGVSALGWGVDGGLSSAYAVVLVVANLALSAALLAWAARISLAALMATALAGYAVRLGLVVAAVWAVRDAAWVEMVPLGVTLLVAHLGLLAWETRFVSMSLAFPGLRPTAADHRRQGDTAADHRRQGDTAADHRRQGDTAADHRRQGDTAADHRRQGDTAADHRRQGDTA